MKPEHHSTVFFEIKLLLDLHNGFYTDLYNTVESLNLNDACISKAFFNWSSFFIIYGDYLANLEKAQYLVTDLMKKFPAFCEAKQQCEVCVVLGFLKDFLTLKSFLKCHSNLFFYSPNQTQRNKRTMAVSI